MKKSIILAAAALLLASATGCEELANSIATTPAFTIPEVTYAGQVYQITRSGTCNYAWSMDDAECKIVSSSEDKKAYFHASLGSSTKVRNVTVTARNADDASIDPCTVKTAVTPWTIVPYVYDGGENATAASPGALKAGTKYIFKMVADNKPVKSIMKSISKLWSLTYSFSSTTNVDITEQNDGEEHLTCIFTPKKAGSFKVTASFVGQDYFKFQGTPYSATCTVTVTN